MGAAIRNLARESIVLPENERLIEEIKRRAVDYYLEHLRSEKTDEGLTFFEDRILDEMSKITQKPRSQLLAEALKLRRLEANPAFLISADFPRLHKQAKLRVIDEIRERIKKPENQVAFLVEKMIAGARKLIEKDYLLAIKELKDRQKAEDFAACMAELRFLSGQPIINEGLFKKEILTAIKNGYLQELVHIKSLRYTYPEGRGVKILEDTNQAESLGCNGEVRVYPSEEVIFERLNVVRSLFGFYGVKTRLTLLVANRDLDYLFPQGNHLANEEEIQKAREAGEQYIDFLRVNHPEVEEILSLSEYLSLSAAERIYESICHKAINEGKKGGGEIVPPKILEMRVSHQYKHYREFFGTRYSRYQARYTAIHQIGNLLALAAVFETFPRIPILVIDSRGYEDNLIGGYNPRSRVILRTRLKDPVEVKKC